MIVSSIKFLKSKVVPKRKLSFKTKKCVYKPSYLKNLRRGYIKMNYDPEYIEDLKNEDLTHEVTDIDHATLDSLEVLTGIPKAYFKREVVIFKPLINPMQQGRATTIHYEIRFSKPDSWNNPLMGWNSTRDPSRGLRLKFRNLDTAIEFCKKNGLKYRVEGLDDSKPGVERSYSDNFTFIPPAEKSGLEDF